MTKKICIVLTLLSSLSFSILAQKKTIYDYWADTHLDSSLVLSLVNDENCIASERLLVACMETLRKLEGAVNDDFDAVQANLVHGDRFNELKIEFSEIKRVTKDKLKKHKAAKLARYRKAFYKINQNSKISFVQTIKKQFSSIRENQRNKYEYYLAQAINSFQKVAADPHSYIVPVEYENDRSTGTMNRSKGFGISMERSKEGYLITRVHDGSPAQKNGLLPGDIINEIDNICVDAEMRSDDSIDLFKGDENVEQNFTIIRNNKTLTLEILPGYFEAKNVTSQTLKTSSLSRVGYIKINSFAHHSMCRDVVVEMKSLGLGSGEIENLIIDLRDNGGGYISQARCLADLFLPKDRIVTSMANLSFKLEKQVRTESAALYRKNLVVLVNGNSASASELFSSAMLDHDQALIVGAPTYGKGSYQDASPINFTPQVPGTQIYLRKTRGLYLSPKIKSVQMGGVPLHVEIDEVSHSGKKIDFLRERDLFLYPLQPSEPQKLDSSAVILSKKYTNCLALNKSKYKKIVTVNNSTDLGFLVDSQLAKTVSLFECNL